MATLKKSRIAASDRRTRRRSTVRKHLIEHLEDRRLLAVASPPDQLLDLNEVPVFIGSGNFGGGSQADLVSVGGSGDVQIALNADDNSWDQVLNSSPVSGQVLGAETLLQDADAFDDLLLLTDQDLNVLLSDGNGGWNVQQSVPFAGIMDATSFPVVDTALGLIDGNFNFDFVVPLPQSSQVAIFISDASGFSAPSYLSTGLAEPVAVEIGSFVGSPANDLVVGHSDGSIAFLEGDGTGSFVLRTDLTTTVSGSAIGEIQAADFERDGVAEIVVLSDEGVSVLTANPDALPESPISNGGFSAGLSDWQVVAEGQEIGESAGRIQANSGFAQFIENQSFLTTLSQTFLVPESPQTLQFDLLSLRINAPNPGSIPDAFEVSLLDANSNSLVPPHHSLSTAFVNFGPDGSTNLGASSSFIDGTLTLDISLLTPGTEARLIFDLVGNPDGNNSTASIDSVRITPETFLDEGFTPTQLPGNFVAPQRFAIGDVEGDQDLEIVVTDAGRSVLSIYSSDASGGFASEELILSTPSDEIALGIFSASDSILDIAISAAGQPQLVTPLVFDQTLPTVQLLAPPADATVQLGANESAASAFGSITLQFSEPMFAPDSVTDGSASNPANYRFYNYGPDGIDEGGSGDDVTFSIDSASYDSVTNQVSLGVDLVALADPSLAAGSLYAVVALAGDAATGLRDLAGNLLDGGQDSKATVRLDRSPELSALPIVVIDEGSEVNLSTTLTHNNFAQVYIATIDWGDGTSTQINGTGGFPTEDFAATHRYADNGLYRVSASVVNTLGEVATASSSITVLNVAPTVTATSGLTGIEGVENTFTLGDFSDPGFSDAVSGSVESFVAIIDWGDGSQPETIAVPANNGRVGVATFGSVVAAHTYADDGIYETTIELRDDDMGSTSVMSAISIANVAPGVSELEPISGQEGELATLNFTASDGTGSDNLTATIDWGDGSSSQADASFDGTQWIFNSGHYYADNGVFTVQATVSDGTDEAAVSTSADVANVAPTLSTRDFVVESGNTVQLKSIVFSDPGFSAASSSETFTASIDWGDGSPVVSGTILNLANGSASTLTTGEVFGEYQYAQPGTYTVMVTVADDDGGSTTESFVVVVNPPTGGNAWLPNIDFTRGATGQALAVGIVDGQPWQEWGVQLSSGTTQVEPAFFSLASGASLGLVSSGSTNPAEGTLVFEFDREVMLDAIALGDVPVDQFVAIRLFNAAGQTVSSSAFSGSGSTDGMTQADLDAVAVARLEIDLIAGAVIEAITFCREADAGNNIEIAGLSDSEEGTEFELQLNRQGLLVDSWNVYWGDGTVDTIAGDVSQVSHIYVDGDATFDIFVTANESENIFAAQPLTVSIQNVVPTLTISGASSVLELEEFTLDLAAQDPGVDTITSWLLDWGDGSPLEVVNGDPSSVSHTYQRPGTFYIQAHARDEDYSGPDGTAAFETEWTAPVFELQVLADSNEWLPTIDFERDGMGAALRRGDRITDQFANLGVQISTSDPHKPAMIFDSSHPTGYDYDLGSPNRNFGGPGRGHGGAHGPGENRQPLSNVLIISEDNNPHDPDDNAAGGTLIFEFDMPVMMDEVHMLDIDKSGSLIRLFGSDGNLMSETSISDLGNNSFQVVELNATNVTRMEIVLAGSGAVAAIVSCREGGPIQPAPSRFYVVDSQDKDAYRYSATGSSIGSFDLVQHGRPRGAATTDTGNPLWVVNSNKYVKVYDTQSEEVLGYWRAKGIERPEGIATDGEDVWIVDDASNRVFKYQDAASRRSGWQFPASSFKLSYGNRNPSGITTDGEFLYVVDSQSKRVFVYNQHGYCLNWWKLDRANKHPSGLTINPGQEGMWVVDRKDDVVYKYPLRSLDYLGRQNAESSFALAPGNNRPEGIADPSQAINIGDTVTESLSANDTFDWTFTANPGDEIYTVFASLTGAQFFNTVNTTLLAPSGSVVYSKTDFRAAQHNSGPQTLTEAGTYTLQMTSDADISFSFTLNDIPAPELTPNIQFAQVYSGNIESPGAHDLYTFTGTANSEIFFDATALNGSVFGGAIVTFLDSSGTEINSISASRVFSLDHTVEIPNDDTYTIEVRGVGADTPTYSFQIIEIPAPDIETIEYGELANGNIEVAGAVDQWIFDAEAGDNVFIDFKTLSGGELSYTVTSPSGASIFTGGGASQSVADTELLLSETGAYTITAEVAFGQASTPTYSFIIYDIPPLVPQPALLNAPFDGTLLPGEQQIFLFDVVAGTEVLLDVLNTNNDSIGIQLQAPDGSFVTPRTLDDQIVTLDQSGIYQAIVQRIDDSPLGNDAQGPFEFRLQDITNRGGGALDSIGTRFYVGFQRNLLPLFGGTPDLSLAITSAVDTSGAVIIPGLDSYQTFDIIAGQSTTIQLNELTTILQNDQVADLGVIVATVDEAAVYGLNQFDQTTDGFTALPLDALGQDYRVLAYPNTVALTGDGGSSLAIVGTQDNTLVTITPSVDAGVHAAGLAFTIMLDEGQLYQLYASAANANGGANLLDLTGTTVSASAAVAVYGGNTAAYVPAGFGAADHLIEQMPPIESWGSSFLTTPLATRTGGDTLRILAASDNTEVVVNGSQATTLNAGEVFETILTQASSIETSQPSLVAQFSHGSTFDGSTGDPFMMLVPPTEQFQNAYTMTTPQAGINSNFVNLIVPDAVVGIVEFDGTAIASAEFAEIAGSGYSAATLPISVGSHNFSSPEPIAVSIYGYDNFDSYGYFGGMSFAPVGQVENLTLEPSTISVPLNSQTSVTAAVEDASGVGLQGIRVDFEVVGANPGSFTAFTDSNGRATIQYTGTSVGDDIVTASSVGLSAISNVTWLASPPVVSITTPVGGSELPPGDFLLQGTSSATLAGASIVEARIDGRPVETLDALGNFFTTIDVGIGTQSFTVEVTDSFGQFASQSVTIVGVQESSDPSAEESTKDISAAVGVLYSGTTYNRRTNELAANMELANNGVLVVDPTIVARLDSTGAATVELSNPDTISNAGETLVLFDSEVASSGLNPGATTATTPLEFANQERTRFAPDFTILASANRAPSFTSIPRFEAVLGNLYDYQAQASDPDGQALSFELLTAPDSMTINPTTGAVSWLPLVADTGSHAIELQVSDGRGASAIQRYTLTVGSALANRPPVITSIPQVNATPGEDYQYQVLAEDQDQDSITFSLTNAPASMTIDAAGLATLPNATAGVYLVSVQVSDGRGGFANQNFSLNVGNNTGYAAPIINSTPVVTAIAGSLYVYGVAATDVSGTAITYSLANSPSGMSIDATTGRITWQPELFDVGVDFVQVEVTNAFGGSAIQSFNLETITERPNVAPAFVSSGVTVATVNEPYSYQALAEDDPSQELSYELLVAPTAMTIDSVSGLVTWNPNGTDIGSTRVLLSATDPAGAKAYQQYFVDVRPVNSAPEITSAPVTDIQVGDLYRYDAAATDDADEVTYSLAAAPIGNGGMQIDSRSGAITWQPGLAEIGEHIVIVRATDQRGASVDQNFTLTVTEDTEAPLVTIVLSTEQAAIGEVVNISVQASDNVAVETLELFNGSTPISLSGGQASFVGTEAGFAFLTANATDASGNSANDSTVLQIGEIIDDTPPTVSIASPSSNSVVTYLTDVIATVTDENLKSYKLEYSRLNDDTWTIINEVAVADGTPIDVTDQVIGTFDPTLLHNDEYQLRVTAEDLAGNLAFAFATLSLDGQAKLGNFSVALTDLNIPLAGIPIQINRVYDTLEANESLDFGFGWKLDIASPRIRESARISSAEAAGAGIFGANPFRVGSRVYMNSPTGRRVGFTFDPTVEPGLLGPIWHPRFVADPGVYDRLEVPDIPLSQSADGTFGTYLTGFAYNPDTYTLVTKDQLRYTYNQFQDIQLTSIVDRNNVTLTLDESGIRSSIGPEITWTRDSQGRITAITDPAGKTIDYTYTPLGDLESVTDQISQRTSMTYLSEPLHYLESITDPRGNRALSLGYDEQGRLTGQGDALGNSTTQTYDLPNNTEVIADRLGNETTLVFDDRGNITEERDPLGNSVLYAYDANDNEIRITNKRGFASDYEYDAIGNVTKVTDALNGVTSATYNARNDVTSFTDELSRTTNYRYDSAGNLTEIVNPLGDSERRVFDSEGRILSLTDENGNVTSFEYQSFCSCAGNPSKITLPDGATQEFTYNIYSQILSSTDELGQTTTFTYDDIGQLLSFAEPNGQLQQNEYVSNNLVKQTTLVDGNTRVTDLFYDENNNLIRAVNAIGGVTLFSYDAEDNLTSVTDPENNTTTFVLDALQRVETRRDPLGSEVVTSYDENGNSVLFVDRNGRRQEFTYDQLDRQTLEVWKDNNGVAVDQISSAYDAVDNRVSTSDSDSSYTIVIFPNFKRLAI
ncbi:MAG: putative Ig domain-containing protein [Planctomycetota bacterium]